MRDAEPKSRKRRVFVVDDHPVVRDGLRSVIEQESDLMVCGEAAEAAEALAGIPAASPDLILLDLSLGESFGMELLKDLGIQHPSIPVVVLSMHDEMIYAERVLRAGARGYLMKAESSKSLLTAIRQVLTGKVFVSDNVVTQIASTLGKTKNDLLPIKRLSDRELQVFELIGKGLSTSEIAERMHLSLKTVQAYVARAKEKLDVPSFQQLSREAFRWEIASSERAE
ncbi:MAG: response regulator transcription factor [Verrucomicrobiota bacterium]